MDELYCVYFTLERKGKKNIHESPFPSENKFGFVFFVKKISWKFAFLQRKKITLFFIKLNFFSYFLCLFYLLRQFSLLIANGFPVWTTTI